MCASAVFFFCKDTTAWCSDKPVAKIIISQDGDAMLYALCAYFLEHESDNIAYTELIFEIYVTKLFAWIFFLVSFIICACIYGSSVLIWLHCAISDFSKDASFIFVRKKLSPKRKQKIDNEMYKHILQQAIISTSIKKFIFFLMKPFNLKQPIWKRIMMQ